MQKNYKGVFCEMGVPSVVLAEHNFCGAAISPTIAVADLEGAGARSIPLFARNLPLNVSKTQDFRLKIREFFAISGGGVPFEISESATGKSIRTLRTSVNGIYCHSF
jgi:hypothetical protein